MSTLFSNIKIIAGCFLLVLSFMCAGFYTTSVRGDFSPAFWQGFYPERWYWWFGYTQNTIYHYDGIINLRLVHAFLSFFMVLHLYLRGILSWSTETRDVFAFFAVWLNCAGWIYILIGESALNDFLIIIAGVIALNTIASSLLSLVWLTFGAYILFKLVMASNVFYLGFFMPFMTVAGLYLVSGEKFSGFIQRSARFVPQTYDGILNDIRGINVPSSNVNNSKKSFVTRSKRAG